MKFEQTFASNFVVSGFLQVFWVAHACRLNLRHCKLRCSELYNESIVVDDTLPTADILWCPSKNDLEQMNHIIPLQKCSDGTYS